MPRLAFDGNAFELKLVAPGSQRNGMGRGMVGRLWPPPRRLPGLESAPAWQEFRRGQGHFP